MKSDMVLNGRITKSNLERMQIDSEWDLLGHGAPESTIWIVVPRAELAAAIFGGQP